jgi:glycosyltransferase involved in cell wall biosynthesis
VIFFTKVTGRTSNAGSDPRPERDFRSREISPHGASAIPLSLQRHTLPFWRHTSRSEGVAMKISVVMTVYSETDLLRESVRQIRSELHEWPIEILIVVHPKSSAECMALCDELGREEDIRIIVQSPRSGIGWAYREAIPYVTGTHVLIMASDLETNPADAPALVRKADETGADIVCASRWMRGGGFSGYSPLKLVLNFGYNLIFRALYRTSIHDITYGYKLIRSEVLRRVNWQYGAHEFYAELLLRPLRLGYTTAEVATRWIKRPEGDSKMTFMRNFRFASAAWHIFFAPKAASQLSSAGAEPGTIAR